MYQCGMKWPEDPLCPDSMMYWIIKTSQGFTNMGSCRISESVRAYMCLILISQFYVKLHIIGNMPNALTA